VNLNEGVPVLDEDSIMKKDNYRVDKEKKLFESPMERLERIQNSWY
jgi:hypothetical protein